MFRIESAAAWASAWPGPGSAIAENGALVITLPSADPELPARLSSLAALSDGDYAPPVRVGSSIWSYAPANGAGRAVLVSTFSNVRDAVREFQRGALLRLDGLPSDRAAGLRSDPAFLTTETAETWVLVLDVPDEAARAALAALIAPRTICQHAFFDPDRAATRIAPPMLSLPDPAPMRPPAAGLAPREIAIATEDCPDGLLLLNAVRIALRQGGVVPSNADETNPASIRIVRLAASSSASAPFFSPLRPLAALRPDLARIFEALDSALDPEERAEWIRAVEGTLLGARLVVPLAQGRIFSLVSRDCPLELDPFGRYVRRADSKAARR